MGSLYIVYIIVRVGCPLVISVQKGCFNTNISHLSMKQFYICVRTPYQQTFLRPLLGGHRSSFCILYVLLYVCLVTFSRPLIGQKWECYIVEEVIDVD